MKPEVKKLILSNLPYLIFVYLFVELAGDLSRVELFARQKTPGWDVWGNEVTSDLTLT